MSFGRVAIEPFRGRLPRRLELPGSKYIANRSLLMAALARGESELHRIPDNEDIRTTVKVLRAFNISIRETSTGWKVLGIDGRLTSPPKQINTGSSGTLSRLILTFAALCEKGINITASPQMNGRPMKGLLQALIDMGVDIRHDGFHLPVSVRGPLRGGRVNMNGQVSSQYFSSLLLSGVYACEGVEVKVDGSFLSSPYVDLTLDVMGRFGVRVDRLGEGHFAVPPGQRYRATNLTVEADPVSAAYFLAGAALLGGETIISHFPVDSPQEESHFAYILEKMGARVKTEGSTLILQGPASLKAVDVDMGGAPDVVPTLAVIAAFARGETVIRNIAHLKYKESDRIYQTATGLRKLGVEVRVTENAICIKGGIPRRALIDPCDDHRLAMSFAIAGLRTGMEILHPCCVDKSFPGFWNKLKEGGVELRWHKI